MAHAFDNHNASLSEGAPLAAVVGALPGKAYWKRVGTDSPRRLRESEARLRLACPRLARRTAREGRRWRERPPVFGRWCVTGERSPAHIVAHGKHSPRGGRSLHSDPCGKATGHPAGPQRGLRGFPGLAGSGRPAGGLAPAKRPKRWASGRRQPKAREEGRCG